MTDTKCPDCGNRFQRILAAKGTQIADRGVCPNLLCRAVREWTAEDWEGKARMAKVRLDCSIPLNVIDMEALKRAGIEVPHTASIVPSHAEAIPKAKTTNARRRTAPRRGPLHRAERRDSPDHDPRLAQ